VLIVRGSETSAVAPTHADRLAEAAKARKRAVEVVTDQKAIGEWLNGQLTRKKN
jgi:hypothetical protein